MNIRIEDGLKILTPDEGKYLTNGETYTATEVYMAPTGDETAWTEVDSIPNPPEPDVDLTDAEALNIILGNETK